MSQNRQKIVHRDENEKLKKEKSSEDSHLRSLQAEVIDSSFLAACKGLTVQLSGAGLKYGFQNEFNECNEDSIVSSNTS